MDAPRDALRGRVQAGLGAAGPVRQAQGRHQRLRCPVLSVAGAKSGNEVAEKNFGKEMMSLTASRRDLSMNTSGTEVDMTPPGHIAAMIAVAGVRAPAQRRTYERHAGSGPRGSHQSGKIRIRPFPTAFAVFR
jgi:hypothetical protein